MCESDREHLRSVLNNLSSLTYTAHCMLDEAIKHSTYPLDASSERFLSFIPPIFSHIDISFREDMDAIYDPEESHFNTTTDLRHHVYRHALTGLTLAAFKDMECSPSLDTIMRYGFTSQLILEEKTIRDEPNTRELTQFLGYFCTEAETQLSEVQGENYSHY